MIKTVLPFFLAILLAACSPKQEANNESSRPNIICLVAEDISPYLGCYGDAVAVTPAIDKLASEGIRFNQMHSVSGVCAPSRNALITGMYPSSIGGNNMRTGNRRHVENVPDSLQLIPYECTPPPSVKCFTEYLRKAGYYCTNNAKEDYQFKAPRSAWDESGQKAHWRNRPAGKPFFAIFNFMRSHESQIWGWKGEPLSVHPDSVVIPAYLPDTKATRQDFAQMHTNNTIMDREVGEMLAELEEEGLLENTIIIFYADNGGPMPRGKREILESGTRVPFIVKFPDKREAGTVNNRLCSFVDIPPTILSLANIEVPAYMQGKAFLGKQNTRPREYVFAARDRMDEWFDCRRAVRDKKFRYVKNYRPDLGAYMDIQYRKQMNTMQELLHMKDAGQLNADQMIWFRNKKAEEELYDLEADPFELHNVAGDPKYRKDLDRLRKIHEAWVKEIDDKGIKYQTEKELMESMWPQGVQPATTDPVIRTEAGKIELSCETDGASIVYQVNHAGYNKHHWFLYDKPFESAEGDTITVIAHRIGFTESNKVETVFR